MEVPESNALTFTLPHDPVAGANLKKPPTQGISVAGGGIDAHRPMESSYDYDAVNLRLSGRPPFQQFLREQVNAPATKDDAEWALNWLRRQESDGTLEMVYATYFDWHKSKGLWPNETPLGEVVL